MKLHYFFCRLARILFILLAVFMASSKALSTPVQAVEFGNFEADIPGVTGSIDTFANKPQPLSNFVELLANLVIGGVIIIGLISIIIGGYFYMTAGGDGKNIEKAKVWTLSALSGIVLALIGWVILNLINPSILMRNL